MTVLKTIAIIVLVAFVAQQGFAQALVCGKDIDGDGKATHEGETAECVGDTGNLCPIQAVSCSGQQVICPSGGTFNTTTELCEIDPDTLEYTCPVNNTVYQDAVGCSEACNQTAACTQSVTDVTLSGTANPGTYLTGLGGGGNVLNASPNGQISIAGALLSGSSLSGLIVTGIAATAGGTALQVYCNNGSLPAVPCGVISVSGSTVSGSIMITQGWLALGVSRLAGSGNTLSGTCAGLFGSSSCGTITFGAGTSGYTCPLGEDHECDQDNTCTAPVGCTASGIDGCRIGYTQVTQDSICTYDPCAGIGDYDPATNTCTGDPNMACPLGSYTCINNNGLYQCSAIPCFNPTEPGNEIEHPADDSMHQDDGPRDENGNCLGEIYIFEGKASTCNTAGQESGWKNCCLNSDESPMRDSIGTAQELQYAYKGLTTAYHVAQVIYYGSIAAETASTAVAAGATTTEAMVAADSAVMAAGGGTYVGEVAAGVGAAAEAGAAGAGGVGAVTAGLEAFATALFNPVTLIIAAVIFLVVEFLLSGSCTDDDLETAMSKESGRCHYLTSYCVKEWAAVGCVQEQELYCCFNSKLARIIHEQGRPQLKSFTPTWEFSEDGYANCRGFTPAEFQMLDFSKMDLREYFDELKTKTQQQLQNTVTDRVNEYYNAIETKP